MWSTLLQVLCCPKCEGRLDLGIEEEAPDHILGGTGPADARSGDVPLTGDPEADRRWIDVGLLLCPRCRTWFPILRGVPVLLPYTTGAHAEFRGKYGSAFPRPLGEYAPPDLEPMPGEQFVGESFSKEWTDYEYDGTIWDLSYEDHEARFLAEVGPLPRAPGHIVEVGCGIGLSTEIAQRNFGGEAIGVDLSRAVFTAAEHFKGNPCLHFVQASVFHLPLKRPCADLVYTHGVLHHTCSTEAAFRALAPICAPGGLLYVWVYGPGSTGESVVRKVAYLAEEAVRPVISRSLDSPASRTFLRASALGYLGVNAVHRFRDRTVQRYDFRKALHAAQDRFTPEFAHRHEGREVRRWFWEEGFTGVEEVDWRAMPSANQANYRRNTGVRGVRASG